MVGREAPDKLAGIALSSSTAFTVWPSGLRPKRVPQMLAISSKFSGGCSALRSTIFLRMAGGSTLRLAFGEEKRLSMPSSRKAAILR